jgi:hypothetical protein
LTYKTILGGIKKVNHLYPGSGSLKRPLEVFNLLIDTKMGKEAEGGYTPREMRAGTYMV